MPALPQDRVGTDTAAAQLPSVAELVRVAKAAQADGLQDRDDNLGVPLANQGVRPLNDRLQSPAREAQQLASTRRRHREVPALGRLEQLALERIGLAWNNHLHMRRMRACGHMLRRIQLHRGRIALSRQAAQLLFGEGLQQAAVVRLAKPVRHRQLQAADAILQPAPSSTPDSAGARAAQM